jgi:hypothetical protein
VYTAEVLKLWGAPPGVRVDYMRDVFILKFGVLWDIAPCSYVEVDRRFRDAYCDGED